MQTTKEDLLKQIHRAEIKLKGISTMIANLHTPDFITFLRHHMAHIENQLITSNNWVVLGGASEKHVPL